MGSSATLNDAAGQTKPGSITVMGLPISAIAFLILTLGISLVWSHFKLMWEDEVFELWTDRVPSLLQLIHVQRITTTALELLLYHALSHADTKVIGHEFGGDIVLVHFHP